jgi:hypothetical protein
LFRSLLAALVLALGIGVAGYSALLTLRRGPVPAAPSTPPSAAPTPPPAPQRVFADGPTAAEPVPMPVARDDDEAIEFRIRLTSVPDDLPPTAGVAVFATEASAEFTWLPIQGTPLAADGSCHLTAATRVVGELRIVLAAAPTLARHSWLCATHVRPVANLSEPAEFVLEVAVQKVEFRLPAGAGSAGPLQIVRLDAPMWTLAGSVPEGLCLQGATPRVVLLGAGAYELRDPLASTRRQPFTVPGHDHIVVNETLATGRAYRP